MVETKATRRLAAILAADMAGYSRLIEMDEAGTIARLRAHRKELIDPKVTEHHRAAEEESAIMLEDEVAKILQRRFIECGRS